MCGWDALVMGVAKIAENLKSPLAKQIAGEVNLDKNTLALQQASLNLCVKLTKAKTDPVMLDDKLLEKFVKMLPDLRVIVYGLNRQVLWQAVGNRHQLNYLTKDPKTIALLFTNNHFVLITSPRQFVSGKSHQLCFGCLRCFTPACRLQSSAFNLHKCVMRYCPCCYLVLDDKTIHPMYNCENCEKQVCRPNHTCNIKCRGCHGPAVANRLCENCKICVKCRLIYPNGTRHTCVLRRMSNRERKRRKIESGNYYVFDFESMMDEDVEISRGGAVVHARRHKVNFVCWKRIGSEEDFCTDNLEGFIDAIAELASDDSEVCFIAHNLKGYDGRLLFDHLVKNGRVPSNVIWRGSKILTMSVDFNRKHPVVFRDSYCHIAFPLKVMPDIFGLDKSKFKKGYFPHKFNIPENQSYIGAIPCQKYFEPDFMSPAARQDFLKWYETQKDMTYNFNAELKAYCRDDVKLLAEALAVYASEGEKANGLNPLACVTIAQYAMSVYRSTYMPAENGIYKLSQEAQSFARNALFGGRTDVRQLARFWTDSDVAKGYFGVYQDVQSLYPTVQFYDDLPTGIPTITKFGDNNQPSVEKLKSFFGFVKLDLECTEYLHHPVLVEKKDGKLMADLLPKQNVSAI